MNQSPTSHLFGAEYLRPSNTPPGKQRKPDYSVPIEPFLTPTYGCRAWTPQSTCQQVHPHGPIPRGAHVYCEACSITGIEGHPVFHRDAIDRNGDRQWPIGETRTKYQPGELPGGTGPTRRPKTNREQRDEQDQLFLALSNAEWSVRMIAAKFDTKALAVKAAIARARVIQESA